MGKILLKAGVIGGLYGVLVQILYIIFAQLLPPGNAYAQAWALVSGGGVAFLLYITGKLDFIEKEGAFGTIHPLIGLPSAVANNINAMRKDGKDFISAFIGAPKPMTIMLASNLSWSLIASVIAVNTNGTYLPVSDPGYLGHVQGIVWSFVIMFLLSFAGQWIMMKVKPCVANVMAILFGFHAAGNILSWFGIGQLLNSIAPGGFGVPIMGGGAFLFNAVYLGANNLTGRGWDTTIEMVLIYSANIASMYVWGGLGALVRGKSFLKHRG